MSKSQQAQRAPNLTRAAPSPSAAPSQATAGNAAAAEQGATLQARSASTAREGAATTTGVADTSRPTGSFEVLGQRFGTLQALHDGNPVRVSNASNGNRFTGNTAQNSGHKAFMSEFYNPTAHEADSTGNIVSENRTGNLFRADAKTQKAKKAKASVDTMSRVKRAALAA